MQVQKVTGDWLITNLNEWIITENNDVFLKYYFTIFNISKCAMNTNSSDVTINITESTQKLNLIKIFYFDNQTIYIHLFNPNNELIASFKLADNYKKRILDFNPFSAEIEITKDKLNFATHGWSLIFKDSNGANSESCKFNIKMNDILIGTNSSFIGIDLSKLDIIIDMITFTKLEFKDCLNFTLSNNNNLNLSFWKEIIDTNDSC